MAAVLSAALRLLGLSDSHENNPNIGADALPADGDLCMVGGRFALGQVALADAGLGRHWRGELVGFGATTMNVILFQNRFESSILAGVKDCTIRARRKDGRPRAREGEMISLRLWTGRPYRSKQRELAQRTVKFTFPVRVDKQGIERLDLAGVRLVPSRMAKALGFENWHEAREWYHRIHGLPFEGILIHFPDNHDS